ncbi:YicC/YloC family endoribonuclease [Aestuariibius insulae]|uniref:YicC/YloC family endoribonuclease n=1 Tax=Aestuariibius insulae TaxID=2058287 RepID=UPI00345EB739
MTAYATHRDETSHLEWSWELRGVNAKGLDLRLRFPDGLEVLDPAARKYVASRLHRGSISLSLKVSRLVNVEPTRLNDPALDVLISHASDVSKRLEKAGLPVAPIDPVELLSRRGVLVVDDQESAIEADTDAILSSLSPLLDSFLEMRAREGAALKGVIADQAEQMKAYILEARRIADDSRDTSRQILQDALQRVMSASDVVDPDRLAQEAALLAIKGDITEELDRLDAHVKAVEDLLEMSGPVGRKLDFLMQEFNREANTLCSKSNRTSLTQVGLDLKAAIEQMREQIQNVE